MAANPAERRQVLAELVRAREAENASGRRRRLLAAAVLLLFVVTLAAAWLLGFLTTPEPVLAVRGLVDEQVAALQRVGRNEAPFDVSADRGAFGTLVETAGRVPEAYRGEVRREMGRLFEAREAAEVDSFFGLPPEQRTAELDRRIKAEEERRQARAAERARRAAERESQGGPENAGGPPPRPAGGPAPAPASAGPPRVRESRRGGTEESRNLRVKAWLDRSTADERSRRGEYRRLKEERRRQLGASQAR